MTKKRSIKKRNIKGGDSPIRKSQRKSSSSPKPKPKPKRKSSSSSTGNTQRQSSASSGKKSKRNTTNQTTAEDRTRRNVLNNLKPTVRAASYNNNVNPCDVYIEQISKMELEKQNIKQFLKVLEEKIKTNNKKNDMIIKKYQKIIQDFEKQIVALKHKDPIVEQPLAILAGRLARITNELLGYKEAMEDTISDFVIDSGKPNYLLQWENKQRRGEQTYEKTPQPVAEIYQSSPTHNKFGNPLYSPGSVENHPTNFLPVFQPTQQPYGTLQRPFVGPDGSIAI